MADPPPFAGFTVSSEDDGMRCHVPGCAVVHRGQHYVDGRRVWSHRCEAHATAYFRWLWQTDPHAGPSDPPPGCRCSHCTQFRAWCLRHGRPIPK